LEASLVCRVKPYLKTKDLQYKSKPPHNQFKKKERKEVLVRCGAIGTLENIGRCTMVQPL
jgi:hypothetical protein